MKCPVLSNLDPFVSLISPMASKDKNTPQKLYKKQKESTVSSRCRLCNRISDPGHSKNIFRLQNQAILRTTEIVYGSNLPQDSNLPHLICAPCKRRLLTLRKLSSRHHESFKRIFAQNVASNFAIDF